MPIAGFNAAMASVIILPAWPLMRRELPARVAREVWLADYAFDIAKANRIDIHKNRQQMLRLAELMSTFTFREPSNQTNKGNKL